MPKKSFLHLSPVSKRHLASIFCAVLSCCLGGCAHHDQDIVCLKRQNSPEYILNSYLFPDSISLFFNSPYQLDLHPRDGNLVEIVGTQTDSLPYNLIRYGNSGPNSFLLIQDCSGSMRPYIDGVKSCINNFIALAGDLDDFRIIQFGGTTRAMKSFTNDKNAAILWIEQGELPRPNGTPLFDALQLGIDYLGSQSSNKNLILFTDGNVSSAESYENLIKWAKEVNIRIFVVGFGTIQPGLLSELAKNTGGIFIMDDQRTSPEIAASLYNWITNYYKLTYSPKSKKLDGQCHLVSFNVFYTPIKFKGEYKVPYDPFQFESYKDSLNIVDSDLNDDPFQIPQELQEVLLIPFYDMGNAVIYPSAKQKLDTYLELLKEVPENYSIRVIVEGFTCDVGSDESNLLLSSERTISVDDYITPRLPCNGSTELHWYGESKPINSNATPSERALNRRVTIKTIIQFEQSAYFSD
ncbi:OmpA family protein [bacterium]|nr:OmpA family protein [bacterium]